MKKQKQRVGLIFIYLILLAVLIFNFESIVNYLDVMYGLIGGIIFMMITNTLIDFESKKEEQEEFKELCKMYGVRKWKKY